MASVGPPGDPVQGVAKAFLVLSLYYTIGVGASVLLVRGVEPNSAKAIELGALGMGISLLAVFGFALFMPPPGRFFGQGVMGRACLWYALMLAAWVPFVFVIYPWLLAQMGMQLDPQPQLEYFVRAPDTTWGPYVVTAVACLLAPAGEEIVFRGYIQGALKSYLPTWGAVVVTAVLFGLMHGVIYALPVGLLGLFFGVIREKYRSLEVAVVAHALHNSLTVAVTFVFPTTLEYGS